MTEERNETIEKKEETKKKFPVNYLAIGLIAFVAGGAIFGGGVFAVSQGKISSAENEISSTKAQYQQELDDLQSDYDNVYNDAYTEALETVKKEQTQTLRDELAPEVKASLEEELKDTVKKELAQELEPEVKASLEETYSQEETEISGIYVAETEGSYVVAIDEKYYSTEYTADQIGGQETIGVYDDVETYKNNQFDFNELIELNLNRQSSTVYLKEGEALQSDTPYTVKKQ